jgi:hypothetical protein
MKQTKKAENAIDTAIASAWSTQANGVQVAMMDVPKIFAEIKAAVDSGHDLNQAVATCVARYRKN